MTSPTRRQRSLKAVIRAFGLALMLCAAATIAAAPGAWAGRIQDLPFPRLGMWWPDLETQPLAEVARYDLVMMDYQDSWAIPDLRELNSDVVLLAASNACEIPADISDDMYPPLRRWLERIPASWLLTQAGANIIGNVGPGETVVTVDRTRIDRDGQSVNLFEPGEEVVLDKEIALVREVDHAGHTLTLKRGHARPAAAHQSGTRIAATIVFWPGSWVMNLSEHCPEETVDQATGPETWAEYRARMAAALTSLADWDGAIMDRDDPNQSWLVGSSSARTIDPDNSNAVLADYDEFDRSWNNGLRKLHSALRLKLGSEALIIGNLALDDFESLNGSVLEGFPARAGDVDEAAPSMVWAATVMGPSLEEDRASYAGWMENALSPPVVLVETYETNEDPAAWGSGANPCAGEDFTPDYRHMRYGLATALMNDGLFSYECGTDGHGCLGLFWFDEYDNAGRGRGYLGRPLGPAYKVAEKSGKPPLVTEGDFSASTLGWTLETEPGYGAHVEPDQETGSLRVLVNESLGDVGVNLAFVPLLGRVGQGRDYVLSFRARAGKAQTAEAWIQEEQGEYPAIADFGTFPLGTRWRDFELPVSTTGRAIKAGLYLGLGQKTGEVLLSGLSLRKGNATQVWRRDFDNGIVLVNATPDARNVGLGGQYRRISGTQAPQVNSGAWTDEADLEPWDGLILLRQ